MKNLKVLAVSVVSTFVMFGYVAGTHLWAAFSSLVGLAARPVPALVRVRSHRRGAGMLEYALIALISIAVFLVLRDRLVTFFGTLMDRIQGEINEKSPTPGL